MTQQQLNACGPGDVLPKFKADAGMVRGPAVESLASLSSPLLFTCKCLRSLLFLSSLLFSSRSLHAAVHDGHAHAVWRGS